jgi:L-iditol 2-dehydrogenase
VFQEYVAHEASMCFKLPDKVSLLEGAMAEPLAVGCHAVSRAGAHPGQTAVVTGSGCIGIVSMMALKAAGVSKVTLIDVVQKRLDKASHLGADHVVNSSAGDISAQLDELTGGAGFDVSIDTTGNDGVVNQLVRSSKRGGTVMFVGYPPSGKLSLALTAALDKELTFKTIFRYCNLYPTAISMIASGQARVKDMVSDVFDFKDIQRALDVSVNDKENIVKSAIRIKDIK